MQELLIGPIVEVAMGTPDRPTYSIGAVARMLDIPAPTLRAWEERYALITPGRGRGAHRLYTRAEVEQLRFIKGQIAAGMSAADAHRILAQDLGTGQLPVAPGRPSEERRPLILIVERDAYAANIAEFILRAEGWDVAIALEPEQASLHFAERAPDVVLLDLLISGGAGFRLLNEFAARHTAQIVAISAIDSADVALHAGASAFVQKPLDPLKLISTVRDLIGTSALVAQATSS